MPSSATAEAPSSLHLKRLCPGACRATPSRRETHSPSKSLLERFIPITLPNRSAESESIVRELFGLAGIEIGGHAVGDIRVTDQRFYERVLRDASIGFGEAYMEEWWETDA